MNQEQKRVKEFMEGIPSQAKNIPEKPSIPSQEILLLRARLIFEESMETIKAMGVEIWDEFLDSPILNQDLTFHCMEQPYLVGIIDGLADINVVVLGTAVACGIDMEPIDKEVMENNMLKLKTGTIREDGKLVKAIDHPKPDIKGELRKQGWEE